MMYVAIWVVAALVVLIVVWIVNGLIGVLSGDRPPDTGAAWADMMRKKVRGSSFWFDLGEWLLETIKRIGARENIKFGIGDAVRVLGVPSDSERPVVFSRCVGKILRVESIDEYGFLELLVRDDGSQAPDHQHNVFFVEPQYVELVNRAVEKQPRPERL
jgi:hypothetical protein